MASDTKRVAIIGAGVSGLVSIKECLAEGLKVQCFEMSDRIGGQWAYTPDAAPDVHSSMYHGCILNSTRDTTAFSDFPMDPARYPDYFSHSLLLRYLGEYADHFGLRQHIRFRTEVLECKAGKEGGWVVTVKGPDGETEELLFDALMCASGMLSKPKMPEFPGCGEYDGEFLHSHYYRTPGRFEGKRVAIIGLGSSAVDISCEIGPQSKETHIITKRGGWILPRFILGKPIEAWDDRLTQKLVPDRLSEWLQTKLLGLVDGKLPEELKPEHKLFAQNPTIRGDFVEKVRTGVITVHRTGVEAFTPKGLKLSDGTQLEVDAVICCTGYDLTHMPFLPRDAVTSRTMPAPHIDLYKHFISPWYEHLYLMGRLENFGPLPPAAEAQARVASAMISGRIKKPCHEKMLCCIRHERKKQMKRYINSDRHLMTVHGVHYVDDVLKPLKASPTLGRVLGHALSGNPVRGLAVMKGVYLGVPTSGQWRLLGQGKKVGLAEATVRRVSGGKQELDKKEVAGLKSTAVSA